MNEEIIKLALEKGGYPSNWFDDGDYDIASKSALANAIVLDPLFWQALGRVLGWHRILCYGCKEPLANSDDEEALKACNAGEDMNMEEWKYYAMHYFDLVLIGGDTESFWQSLLK